MPKTSSRTGVATLASSEPIATTVAFTDDALVVTLEDGRILSVPLEWFPRLRDASPKARRNWRLIGKGYGIHWPTLDEDISVPGLLGLPD
jgi:selenophosphate synthetase-related protein